MELTYTMLHSIARRYIESRMLWVHHNKLTLAKTDVSYNKGRWHVEMGRCDGSLQDLATIIKRQESTIDEWMREIIGDDLETRNAHKYAGLLLERLGIS